MKNLDNIINESMKKVLLEYQEMPLNTEEMCNYIFKLIKYMAYNKINEYSIPIKLLHWFNVLSYGIKGVIIKIINDDVNAGVLNTSDEFYPVITFSKKIIRYNSILRRTIFHEVTHFTEFYEKGYDFFNGEESNKLFNISKLGKELIYLFDKSEINARLNEAYYQIKYNDTNYYRRNIDKTYELFANIVLYKRMKFLYFLTKKDNYIFYKASKMFNAPYSMTYFLQNSNTFLDINNNICPNMKSFIIEKNNVTRQLYKILTTIPKDIKYLEHKLFDMHYE